ncbi:unnamed protein product [Lactuca saligna]|uniref:Uncharacterized protein n=1 Tax=Lactuca saligna TaxID=75948 RepID=A0AA35ZJY4_LACSI|nr:unnamed protein product [Lactuca saligna]
MDWIEKITGVIASLLSSQVPERCLSGSPMGSSHHRSASDSLSKPRLPISCSMKFLRQLRYEPKYVPDYAIFKGKAALSIAPVLPSFSKTDVPADGIFIFGYSLSIDESSMIGESHTVDLMAGCKVADGSSTMMIRLSAYEMMGSATTIWCDKTGTLTLNLVGYFSFLGSSQYNWQCIFP